MSSVSFELVSGGVIWKRRNDVELLSLWQAIEHLLHEFIETKDHISDLLVEFDITI